VKEEATIKCDGEGDDDAGDNWASLSSSISDRVKHGDTFSHPKTIGLFSAKRLLAQP
jgi:hypothetical protein